MARYTGASYADRAMAPDQTSILSRIRHKLGGSPSLQRAIPTVEAKGTGRLPVPAEPDFFSGPPNASAYVNTPDRLSGIPIRKPAGTIPGSLDYPRAKGAPPAATGA